MDRSGQAKAHLFSTVTFRAWLAIAGVAAIATVILAVVATSISHEFLVGELRARVESIVSLGARTVDAASFGRLVSDLDPGLSKEGVSEVEGSADFVRVSDELNAIRDVDKGLILFVYTLAPTDNPATARFVVDSDLLALKGSGADESEVSHFDQSYDIAKFPDMKQAFSGATVVERGFTYDPEFHTNSFSGYAPLYSANGKQVIGLLGIDVSDRNVGVYLERLTTYLVLSILAIVAVTIGVAYLVARSLTAPLGILFALFSRASAGDLTVRYPDRTRRDEIGRTAKGFDHLMSLIHGSVADVLTSAHALSARSESITATAAEIASTSEEQAANIASTHRIVDGFVGAIGEMRGSLGIEIETLERTIATLARVAAEIGQVVEQSVSIQDRVGENVRAAEDGRGKIGRAVADIASLAKDMESVVGQIEAVSVSSENIDRVVQVFAEISERTSILAINAAIEAAHLGLDGAGFRVVAGEIKKIADATTGYAGEIRATLDTIKDGIGIATAITRRGLASFRQSRLLAEETGADLDRIVGEIRSIHTLVGEIRVVAQRQGDDAAAVGTQSENLKETFVRLRGQMKDQDRGMEEIRGAMSELAQTADRNGEVAAQLSDLARLLAERSVELNRIVAQFKLV